MGSITCRRDRASQVRFELKTDKGSFMVSLEPPPEELLFPESISRADFHRVLNTLGQLKRASVDCQVRGTTSNVDV